MNDDDFQPIPDFLRPQGRQPLTPEQQAKVDEIMARAGQPKRGARRKKQHFDLPRSMDAASWAILKVIEAEKRAKQVERFKMLRERRKK